MARHFPSWLPAPLLLLLHLRHACAQCTLPDAALSSGIVGDAAGANENSCTSSMGLNAGESCDVKAAPGYAVDDGSKSYSCVGTNLTKAMIQPTGCLENFFETVANTTCSPCRNKPGVYIWKSGQGIVISFRGICQGGGFCHCQTPFLLWGGVWYCHGQAPEFCIYLCDCYD